MIYQYDGALAAPTMDIYDTGMLKSYIDAVKDDYNRGLAEQKEFMTKYGDFTSPSEKDVNNWYKLGLGSVLNVVQKAQDNGIDLLRSQEGRALLQRAIANVPYNKLAMLKQSAEAQREFNQAKKQLAMKGLYNKDMSQYEGGTPEDYDTLAAGKAWDVGSPTPYQDVATFSDPYFKNITPTVSDISKNGMRYKKTTIDNDMLRNIADQHFNELVKTPQGALMYKQYVDQAGGDDAKARQMFNDALVAANQSRLVNQEVVDDNWFKQQELNMKRRELALAEQKARDDHALNVATLARLQQDSQSTQWSQERQLSSDLGTNGLVANNYHNVMKFWADQYRRRLKENPNASDSQKRAWQKQLNGFEKAANAKDFTNSPYLTSTRNGYVASDKLMRLYKGMLSGGLYRNGSKQAITPESRRQAEEYYKSMSFDVAGDAETSMLTGLFTGSKVRTNEGDSNNQFKSSYRVTFGGKNPFTLTGTRAFNTLGRHMSSNSLSTRMQRYLRNNNVAGFYIQQPLSGAMVPTQNGYDLDVSGYIYVTGSDMQKIKGDLFHHNEAAFRKGLSELGIKPTIIPYSKTKQEYVSATGASGDNVENVQVYAIPVTRTVGNDKGMTFKQLNEQMNKGRYGASNAYKESTNAAAASLMQSR